MAFFMVPRYMEFVKQLPMTETEKVKKDDLKNISENTWDREKVGLKVKR
jgi:crotonobetaine/carnitine-CoA ligase